MTKKLKKILDFFNHVEMKKGMESKNWKLIVVNNKAFLDCETSTFNMTKP